MTPEQRQRLGALATTVAGALIVVGSFMPWITASSGFGSLSRNGIDGGGDGIITLIVGVIALLVGLSMLAGITVAKEAPFILGGIGILMTFIDYRSAADRVSEVDSQYVAASVGTGIWVLGVGSLLCLGAGFILSQTEAESPPPST